MEDLLRVGVDLSFLDRFGNFVLYLVVKEGYDKIFGILFKYKKVVLFINYFNADGKRLSYIIVEFFLFVF